MLDDDDDSDKSGISKIPQSLLCRGEIVGQVVSGAEGE